jgi:protocatechuate 3,4-dioxygenase beta subunit
MTFLLAVLAAAVTLVPAQAGTPTLTGMVGPGFTIVLKKGTTKVRTLKRGTYTIRVSDRSPSHNFHVFGPGVNKRITSVLFVGTKTVTVSLKPGTYTYQCDPHVLTGMKAKFRVVS